MITIFHTVASSLYLFLEPSVRFVSALCCLYIESEARKSSLPHFRNTHLSQVSRLGLSLLLASISLADALSNGIHKILSVTLTKNLPKKSKHIAITKLHTIQEPNSISSVHFLPVEDVVILKRRYRI